jgi:hypothetical protein
MNVSELLDHEVAGSAVIINIRQRKTRDISEDLNGQFRQSGTASDSNEQFLISKWCLDI